MANTCSYKMRIKGKEQDVVDVLHYIHGSGPLVEESVTHYMKSHLSDGTQIKIPGTRMTNGFVGRCGYDGSEVRFLVKDGTMFAELDDQCAWSVMSSMIENERGQPMTVERLEELAIEYDVEMEIYSTEYGVGFCEYYFFNGKRTEEEGYVEDDFNHEDVSEKLSDDGYSQNDDGEWVDKDGNPDEGIFDEYLERLFPWDWRVLYGGEWYNLDEGERTELKKFCDSHSGSWE